MTKSKQVFLDKYKDPRWQKRRLEILEMDNFTCQMCESTEKTLHVHHQYYEYGKDPWDYPHKSLWTFCEDCHKKAESSRKDLKELVKILSPLETGRMLGYMHMTHADYEFNRHKNDLLIDTSDSNFLLGVCEYFDCIYEDIYESLKEHDFKVLYSYLKNIANISRREYAKLMAEIDKHEILKEARDSQNKVGEE